MIRRVSLGKETAVCAGTKNVALIPFSASRPSTRGKPTLAPNSPRETGVGDVALKLLTQRATASKSKVRQTVVKVPSPPSVPALCRRPAAIDHDGLTIHVARLVRQQEQDDIGDLVRLALARSRYLARQPVRIDADTTHGRRVLP